jgi:hypothetical protein
MVCWGSTRVKEWHLGDLVIKTVRSAKILGVVLTDDLSGGEHFDARRKAGWKVFKAMESVGMLCGSLPITDSMFLMSTSVWASVDYGRCVVLDSGPDNINERKKKNTQLLQMCRKILGVDRTAAAAGVLGETGCIMDVYRGHYNCLLFVNRLMDPKSTNKWVLATRQDARHKELPIFKLAAELEKTLPLPRGPGCSKAEWKKVVAPKLFAKAEEAWRQEVQMTESLWLYERYKKNLIPPFYATMRNFQGRDVLVKARISNLPVYKYFAGRTCKRCGESLDKEILVIPGGKVFLHQHVLLGCSEVQPLLQNFLTDAYWLPEDWDSLKWEDQMAHLLFLHDGEKEVHDTTAVRVTAVYLASACEEAGGRS